MMTPEVWLDTILRQTARFADVSFQRESLGVELFGSVRGWTPFWFCEDSCGLFDDARSREFLQSDAAASVCTSAQLEALRAFLEAADGYQPVGGDNAALSDHIDDPAWIRVTLLASRALDAFDLRAEVTARSPTPDARTGNTD